MTRQGVPAHFAMPAAKRKIGKAAKGKTSKGKTSKGKTSKGKAPKSKASEEASTSHRENSQVPDSRSKRAGESEEPCHPTRIGVHFTGHEEQVSANIHATTQPR